MSQVPQVEEAECKVSCELVSPVCVPSIPDTEEDVDDLVAWMGEVALGVKSEIGSDAGSAVGCIKARGLYSMK